MNSTVSDLADYKKTLKSSGGGGTYDPMEVRVAKLEAELHSIDRRLDGIDRRLDRIEDKIPSKWDMAQVIFYVVGALMAAAIFGPRLLGLISAAT
ncbi:hypothetical protein [Phaeobacter gallaeciensis]|uniref:Uncharacterized protein n=1 Tax=Phaeobacter gallaeciensis TaxID=60890 RepID=A0AAC9Z9Y0_9RHOB|nr:hypothetical protein [Phaeobacter gallaeciensis]AHD10031.1 hypothetical protein Gal_02284 [Phaeobacter gallaeciensis DSM 26640]ATE93295.1 hypothetical protein PhaeoP11_02275 [Phaeobacter gallaeciensis]ATE96884.1 hypothetical protein PhaeoP73_01572 [Phaeobacter gallaeciensis]ATF01959.1 hypothetical protein PhaeoP75_02324 [Phaeobacter gallaeciensis]ATF06339.1 hypothetical protein PhaeoP63_02273 [Phaeobacter gallaeciensis]